MKRLGGRRSHHSGCRFSLTSCPQSAEYFRASAAVEKEATLMASLVKKFWGEF